MEPNRQPGNYRVWSLTSHPFVERIWSHRTTCGRTDIIPPHHLDGGSLIFELETRSLIVRGPCSHAFEHSLPGTHRIGLTLRSGYLHHVFGIAAEGVVNTMDAAPVPGLRIPDPAWESEAAMLAFLRGLVQGMPVLLPDLTDVRGLLRSLPRLQGNFTVQAWARAANLTERTLHRHCLKLFGMGPKNFLRINRLCAAMRTLVLGSAADPSLSTIAQEAGYADQSHFCHDCRSLLSCSPQRAAADLGIFFIQ